MECPYCRNAMNEGDITTFSEKLCWTPRGEKRSRSERNPSSNGFLIGKFDFWRSKSMTTAYFCKLCKKIIINIE